MSAKGGVFLNGEVLDVDFKQGKTKNGDPYAFHIVTLLTGKTTTEVRWDSAKLNGQIVKEGETVNVRADFSVYAGRLQCNALAVEQPLHSAKAS